MLQGFELEMLHDEESDNRLLRNNSPKRYAKKAEGRRDSFIKKDGKVFVLKEWDGEEVEEEEDEEAAFSMRPGSTPRRLPKRNIQGTSSRYLMKNCPLDCNELQHTNGSAYFCQDFKNKSREERRLLQKTVLMHNVTVELILVWKSAK